MDEFGLNFTILNTLIYFHRSNNFIFKGIESSAWSIGIRDDPNLRTNSC